MYRLIVSLRYLRSKKLNLIAIIGVAIGVMALLVVLSVMTGFAQEMRSRIRGTLSDLIVEKWTTTGDAIFDGYEDDMKKLAALDHVEACAPRLTGFTLMRVGQTYRNGQYEGIDLERELKATRFAEYYRAWRSSDALQQCRDLLASLEADDAPSSDPAAIEKAVMTAARMLTPSDFNLLTRQRQRKVRELAAREKVDLAAAWKAAAKVEPTWEAPGVTIEGSRSPAIPGHDLTVLGIDTGGREVSVGIGDRIVVVTLSGPFDHDLKICRIVGKFKSGMYDYDLRTIYIPLKQAQDLIHKPGYVSSINLRLDDYANAQDVRNAIWGIPSLDELDELHGIMRKPVATTFQTAGRTPAEISGWLARLDQQMAQLARNYDTWLATSNPNLPQWSKELGRTYFTIMDGLIQRGVADQVPGMARARALRTRIEAREARALGTQYRVSTWEDKRRSILRAVSVERRVQAIILFFMVVLAGFIILAILYTTVMEKTRDIGILKSLGGTVSGIMSIFLLNGLLIGVFGAVLGVLGGVLLCNNLNQVEDAIYALTSWRVFPRDIYNLDRIPVDQDPFWSIVFIATTAVVISFLAALYPGYKAARLHPVEALRYE